jgi:hypothetical protein
MARRRAGAARTRIFAGHFSQFAQSLMTHRTCCGRIATREYLSATSRAESSLAENVRLLSAGVVASSACWRSRP